jgi:hypothetical protein
MDLQWKLRANYNVRLCASFRKSARTITMENNEKNNARSNGNNGTPGRVPPQRPVIPTARKTIARRREAPGAQIQD